MVITRGSIFWADLGDAIGSRSAKRRPVLVISSDLYNQSRLATIVALAITTNTGLAAMPGNVFLPMGICGLGSESVVNVTALATLNKTDLGEQAGVVPLSLMDDVDRGVKRLLGL